MPEFENKLDQKNIWILDTTLRDGEQAPGVIFNTKEKLEIACMLSETGVDEIEVGTPAMGDIACRQIGKIVDLDLSCKLSCWCRAVKEDIELAADCKTSGVHISFPTSSILLQTFDKNESWALGKLEELILFAKQYFDFISVGAQDATRTDETFLSRFAMLAKNCGAKRLRLADTVGIMNPVMVTKMIKKILGTIPDINLEFHSHNDLGMATANAVCAATAGAKALSVTVNGLGERAGNAALEEVSMALFEAAGYHGNIKLSNLGRLCQIVSKNSAQGIAPSKPIIGENVFRHESGIHCSGLLKNPLSYQLFDPKIVGQKNREYAIGYHSGRASISHILSKQGIHIAKDRVDKVLNLVRRKAYKNKRNLSEKEVFRLYNMS